MAYDILLYQHRESVGSVQWDCVGRGFGLLRCGILALLLCAERKYSFSRVRPGVSSTVFLRILSLVSIGLSIVAFTLDCLVVLTLRVGISLVTIGVGVSLATLGVDVLLTTLGVGVSLATLGAAGCSSCGGFAVALNVTHLLRSGAVVGLAGILFRSSSICCSASISFVPFLFHRSLSACVRSLSAFTIVSSGVKVGSVMNLCLKCTVSEILSLRVFLQ